MTRYGSEPGPVAVAHRGGAGLGPENSHAAFSLSVALGVRYLETDVRLTADGRLACFHDARLERVTGASGRVRTHSLEQLRRLRIAHRELIPTIDELLDWFPDRRVMVDVKDRDAVGPLVDAIRRADAADRVCVAGAWDPWLREVRRELPGVTTALGWSALSALVLAGRTGIRPNAALATGEFAHVPWALVGRPGVLARLVEMAAALRVRIALWTIDDAPTMHHVLDLGVDAVITDRPDVLREVLVARGEWTGTPTRPAPHTYPHLDVLR